MNDSIIQYILGLLLQTAQVSTYLIGFKSEDTYMSKKTQNENVDLQKLFFANKYNFKTEFCFLKNLGKCYFFQTFLLFTNAAAILKFLLP